MDTEKTPLSELPAYAESSAEFFSDIEAHLIRGLPDFQTLKVGKKVYLEITVLDSEMTHWLFKWMYGQNKQGGNHTPFGCILEAMHFEAPTNKDLKRKLIELADTL